MDILRNLFGTLTSGIIRLVVAVGILAAAYFIIVKPVLKTTDNAINSANESFEKTFHTKGADITDISKTIDDVNRQMQREIRKSFQVAKQNGNPKKLVKCIERADGNTHRIRRCTVKF
jgi:predicted PurR-regulated permease PerM